MSSASQTNPGSLFGYQCNVNEQLILIGSDEYNLVNKLIIIQNVQFWGLQDRFGGITTHIKQNTVTLYNKVHYLMY